VRIIQWLLSKANPWRNLGQSTLNGKMKTKKACKGNIAKVKDFKRNNYSAVERKKEEKTTMKFLTPQ